MDVTICRAVLMELSVTHHDAAFLSVLLQLSYSLECITRSLPHMVTTVLVPYDRVKDSAGFKI